MPYYLTINLRIRMLDRDLNTSAFWIRAPESYIADHLFLVLRFGGIWPWWFFSSSPSQYIKIRQIIHKTVLHFSRPYIIFCHSVIFYPSSSPGPQTWSPTRNHKRGPRSPAAALHRIRAPANITISKFSAGNAGTRTIRRRPPNIRINHPFSLILQFALIFALPKPPGCPVFDFLAPLPPITPYFSVLPLFPPFCANMHNFQLFTEKPIFLCQRR